MRINEFSGRRTSPRGYVDSGWKATRAAAVLAVLLSKYDLTWDEINQFKEMNDISDWDTTLSTSDDTLIGLDGNIYLPDGLDLTGWSTPYTYWKNGELDVSLPKVPAYAPPAPAYVPPAPAYVPPAPEIDNWFIPSEPAPQAVQTVSSNTAQNIPATSSASAVFPGGSATPPGGSVPGGSSAGKKEGVPMWLIIGGAAILLYFLMNKKGSRSKRR